MRHFLFYVYKSNDDNSQYYVTEFNGKLKKKALSEEERNIYEKDVIVFVEKIKPYCNPQFDER